MNRIAVLFLSFFLSPVFLIAQNSTWPIMAVNNSGEAIPVNVYLPDGTSIPLVAIYSAGNDHFMDVKAVHNGERISIKIITSSDLLAPVKGISTSGEILKVKAEDTDGNILDVKGVSRDGNTINIAAINSRDKYLPLKAISPNGVEREVKGVRFMKGSVEMEYGDILVIAHVKALPIIEVGDINKKWEIYATTDKGEKLNLYAISEKGKEFPITAKMPGKHPYLMNVEAEANVDIFVKLIKNDDGLVLSGIDEFGRLYDVRAKSANGESYNVVGGISEGNVTPIFAEGPDGNQYSVEASSSKGHKFDVKGIKVKEDEVEGIISGYNVWIRYYAHVKALAPAQTTKNK